MKAKYLLAAIAAVLPAALHAQVLLPAQDSFVVTNLPLANGGAQFLAVTGPELFGLRSEGLVQFDLSSLPAGLTASKISHATLTLFLDQVNNPGTMNVYAANGNWTEAGVNGFNAPAPGATVASNVPVSTQFTFVTVDVTTAVQNWVGGVTPNNGFLLQGNVSTDVHFDSKESITTSQPAMLSIVLASSGSASGPAGPTGPQGATGPAGSQGAAGAAGPAGAAGSSGARGATGPQGAAGATGPQGIAGATGSQGAAGATGPQGLVGGVGPAGPAGPQGPAGLNGVGTPGATGPAGPAGPAGSGGGGALMVATITLHESDMLALNQTAATLIPATPGVINIPTRIVIQVNNAYYTSGSGGLNFNYGAINSTTPPYPYPNSAGVIFAAALPAPTGLGALQYLDDVAFPPPLTNGATSLFVNTPYIAYSTDQISDGGMGGDVIFTVWYTAYTLQ